MRIYEGSPRQDFEEVLRSIGAFLDERNMKDILLVEAPDGFIVQGLVVVGATGGSSWSESMGQIEKETLTFLDEDIAKFMDEALARRGRGATVDPTHPGAYQRALRVIGRYIDEQKPRDIFLFEQQGAFVLRLHRGGQTGDRHELIEFTKDDVDGLVTGAPSLRQPHKPATPSTTATGGSGKASGGTEPTS
jgi:hypothetical protein